MVVVLRGEETARRFDMLPTHHSSAAMQYHEIAVVRALVLVRHALIARCRRPVGPTRDHLRVQLQLAPVRALRPCLLLLQLDLGIRLLRRVDRLNMLPLLLMQHVHMDLELIWCCQLPGRLRAQFDLLVAHWLLSTRPAAAPIPGSVLGGLPLHYAVR